MAKDTFGERTQRATPKRREDARLQGQVARSFELNTAILLIAGVVTLSFLGPALVGRLADLCRVFFHGMARPLDSPADALALFHLVTRQLLIALAPLLLTLAAVGVISNVAQVGFVFTTNALTPRWEMLDPIQGFARKFGRRGWVELAKAILKLVLIGTIAYFTVAADLDELLPLAGVDGATLMDKVGGLVTQLGLRIGVALLALAAVDYGYQRWEYEESIKMSTKEIEEEQRQMEGDPQVKSRIRVLQRQLGRNRMISEVAKADVVVTNPTHVAVALKYDRATMAAPVVLARGMRKLAARIRAEAEKHGIPIVEDPPLARLLYKKSKIGQPIPVGLYQAVAQLLAHVWRLRQARRDAAERAAQAVAAAAKARAGQRMTGLRGEA